MAAPKAHIKVSGAFKEVLKMHVRVSGAWKRVNKAYVRVSGAWKQFLQSAVASTFSGSLDGSGSTSTIVGTSRNYQLGAGNSGQVQFRNLNHPNSGGGGVFTYNKAGGGNTTITANDIVSYADLDSNVMRATIMLASTAATIDLYDVDTNQLIQTVTLTRT